MDRPVIAIMVNSLAGDGAERIALTSFKQFQNRGYEVLLICIEKEEGYRIPEGARIFYLTDFEKVSNPLAKVFWVLVSLFRLYKIIQQENIRFIQSHINRSNFINAGAKYLGARHYAQLIIHTPVRFKDAFWLKYLKTMLFTLFYQKADEVVSISKLMLYETEKTLRLERFPLKHRVVYNPHELLKIKSMARQEPENFSFDQHKRYLISAGRLVSHKRVDDIIRAFHTIRAARPDVELLILGAGDQRPFLEQMVREKGLQSCVHFLGYCSNPFSYIARSDLFVMASEAEGLPNIIIESLACQTPVISSDCVSGPREILSPGTDFTRLLTDQVEYAKFGVLFPVGRAGLLAEAISHLLDNENLRKQYAEAGLQRAEQYDEDVIAGHYLNHFSPEQDLLEMKDSLRWSSNHQNHFST